ncbi:MAG TPA: TlyA family RNA methyltransferase [Candidatus Babeliales bacterium]|jgi:23S rRNA (cytidine1920-2'-O)/16S rRNA (cytidine1409-2'-O)-methyltransferase|nr:TlyA family RNA methyltransferase [Candidatus Babeliales bacterium]
MAKIKKRLDVKLHELLPEYDEKHIQSWIMQGKVFVDGEKITKPGSIVLDDSKITYTIEEQKFVSRAGLKLEKALDHFKIDVKNLTVLDAGISTGGFTDCLLQRGAKKVYGVDVGYGDVHEKIRTDERLILLEKTNMRLLESVGEPVDMVTLDLSFISVLSVMPAVCKVLKKDGKLVVLIKPQFEASKDEIGAGGIVRDDNVRQAIVNVVVKGIENYSFECVGVIDSPITGTKGNKELVAYFLRH